MNNASRKQEAKDKRIQQQQEAAKKERMRKLVTFLGGGIALAIVGVILAVIATSGSGNGDADKITGGSEVTQLFAGVKTSDFTIGDENAPLTMVEYVDPQCPFCGEFSRDSSPTIVEDYVKTGKLKVVIKPIAFLGPDSIRAASASYQAAKEGKGPQFLEMMFKNQGIENTGYVTPEYLTNVAKAVGIKNTQALVDAADSTTYESQLQTDEQSFNDAGITGTPGFLLGTSENTGKLAFDRFDVSDPTAYTAAIDEALAAVK